MRVQIGQFGIVAVTVESVLRVPLDENQHLPRLDVAQHRLAELTEGYDAAAVLGHLVRRTLRIRQILVAACDVEKVERIHRHPRDATPPADTKLV